MLIAQGVPLLGGVKQWWGGITCYFEAKCISISIFLKTRRYVQSY